MVIDDAFLQRLRTEDPRTTRDPAIKVLRSWYSHALTASAADLRNGTMTLRIKSLDKDSVEVVVSGPKNIVVNGRDHRFFDTAAFRYTRHRRKDWRFFSADWWKNEVFHRPYWDFVQGKTSSARTRGGAPQ